MKSNQEYNFNKNIEHVIDVVINLRDAGYSLSYYRKCDLEGHTICYHLVFNDLEREYQVLDLTDCLKLIISDAILLGEMAKIGAIVAG